MYRNPEPVLVVGEEYDFGVTQPTGDSVVYIIRNTGAADLVIESMEFENGEFFSVDPYFDFPLTLGHRILLPIRGLFSESTFLKR